MLIIIVYEIYGIDYSIILESGFEDHCTDTNPVQEHNNTVRRQYWNSNLFNITNTNCICTYRYYFSYKSILYIILPVSVSIE